MNNKCHGLYKQGTPVLVLLAVFLFLPSFFISASEESMSIKRFGMFIGSNYGGTDRVRLRFAGSDAATVASILMDMGGIDKDEALLLLDPSLETVTRSFEDVKERIRNSKGTSRRTEFIFYYSGHSDEEGILLGDNKLSYASLRSEIKSIESDINIAILDSCSSGAFTRLKGGSRKSPFLIDDSTEMKGHAFLTSSSADEAAQESDSIQASFFTHYLVSGLRGAADTTRDGKITLNEVYRYAFDETLARTENTRAGPQHPSYDIQLTGAGDLVLTDLRDTTAGILIAESLNGRLFLRDDFGKLVAEVNKIPGIPVTLAIPPGLYSITLSRGEQLFAASVILVSGKKALLEQKDFSLVRREPTRTRGDEGYESNGITIIIDPPSGRESNPRDVTINGFSIDVINQSDYLNGTEMGVINFNSADVTGVQLALVFNRNGGSLSGTQIAYLFNKNGGRVKGFQGSGIFNSASGNVYGGQASSVFNIAEDGITGFQSAGVFNIISGETKGIQTAGIFNIVEGSIRGFQGAGVFNIAENNVYGIQGAGIFNIGKGGISGVQMSGIFNRAEHIKGAQLSLVNTARYMEGVQAGLVNVAKKVKGTQIGLVNVSYEMRGFPVGLINVYVGNFMHAQGWIDNKKYAFAGLQLGGRFLYTVGYTGFPLSSPATVLITGLGAGFHVRLRPFYIDIDVSAKNVVVIPADGEDLLDLVSFEAGPSRTFPSVRTTAGLNIFRRLSFFGGATFDISLPGVFGDNVLNTGDAIPFPAGSHNLLLYPKYYAGVRF